MENLNLINKPESVKPTPQKLKVLWWSNAVHVGSGYGVQSANVTYRLLAMGYDVRVAANYGLDGAALGFNNLIQYPRTGFSELGEDTLKLVIDNWKPHVLISLFDVWISAYSKIYGKDWLANIHPRTIAWLPVDSEPIAEAVADQARKMYRAVAMSQFGQRMLKNADVKALYIPHGVETQIFKPAEDKAACKTWLNKHTVSINPQTKAVFNDNDFIVHVNKANKDRERSGLDSALVAFKYFLDANPDAKKDAKLNLHTWVDFPGGVPIRKMCHDLGIEANVKYTPEYYMLMGLTSNDLARQYNAASVFMNISRGEGFGVPILEAQSCGVPAIVTDFSSMTELVQGHGWLVPAFASDYHGGVKLRNGLNSLWALPDEYKAADALTDAYLHPKDVSRNGELSRLFALNYDFDTAILPLWRDLLGEVESELGMFGTAQQKDDAYAKLFAQATQ